MHRFIEFRTIGRSASCDLVIDQAGVAGCHARAALRADGAVWLLEKDGGLSVNRGNGWQRATRLWLCLGDSVRLGEAELGPDDFYSLFGATGSDAAQSWFPGSEIPGIEAPRPLAMPVDEIGKARRDPDTGQLEHTIKEN